MCSSDLDAAGDAEASVAAWAAAAKVAPDPDDYLRAMSERRYRAYSADESTLIWPGIGRVLTQNQGALLVVRALDRPAKGWALVSFLREHVVFDDDYEHYWTTSIHWESREVCRILLELGDAKGAEARLRTAIAVGRDKELPTEEAYPLLLQALSRQSAEKKKVNAVVDEYLKLYPSGRFRDAVEKARL